MAPDAPEPLVLGVCVPPNARPKAPHGVAEDVMTKPAAQPRMALCVLYHQHELQRLQNGAQGCWLGVFSTSRMVPVAPEPLALSVCVRPKACPKASKWALMHKSPWR